MSKLTHHGALLLCVAAGQACAPSTIQAATPDPAPRAAPSYVTMQPVAQYLIANRDEEVALARSAAPASISADAEILVLGSRGYETAVKGKNGFLCFVERSWANHFDQASAAEFWNPRMRAPNCYNPPAIRSVLPPYLKRTEWVLAGTSKQELMERTKAALANKEYPDPEPGALSYMMSPQGHLNEADGHWHPHVMFFVARTAAASWGWGANLPGSPIISQEGDDYDPVTIFFIPVRRWSDGSPGPVPK
jgi:hypothetical protein